MARGGCAVAVVAAALLLGAPAAAQLAARVVVDAAGEVAFGAPFALRCEREWPADWAPQVLDDTFWAPLAVASVTVRLDSAGAGRLREVREYVVRAATVGDLPARTLELGARGPRGEVDKVAVALPALRVVSGLGKPPGDLEWDLSLRAPAASRRGPLVAALLGGVLLLGGFVLWWRRRAGGTAAAHAPVVHAGPAAAPSFGDALRGLPLPSDDAEAVEAFSARVKQLLRAHLAARFHVPADVRTSEELHALLPRAPGLDGCLHAIDAVLFGARRVGAAGARQLRDDAVGCVVATAGEVA